MRLSQSQSNTGCAPLFLRDAEQVEAVQLVERHVAYLVDRLRPVLVAVGAKRHHTVMALPYALVAVAMDMMHVCRPPADQTALVNEAMKVQLLDRRRLGR